MVVALALVAVTFVARRATRVRIALAVALACDIVASVARANGVALDVAIAATFLAACVLIVDVVTARGRSAPVDATVVAPAREDRTSSDVGADGPIESRAESPGVLS